MPIKFNKNLAHGDIFHAHMKRTWLAMSYTLLFLKLIILLLTPYFLLPSSDRSSLIIFSEANQWSFENYGRRFPNSNVTLPDATIRTWVFTSDGVWMKQNNVFEERFKEYNDCNKDFDSMKSDMAEWAWE